MLSIDPSAWIKDFFIDSGLGVKFSSALTLMSMAAIVAFLSWLSNLVAKAIILRVVSRIVKKSASKYDDVFLEHKVFTKLSHFAPVLVIWFLAGWAFKSYPTWFIVVHKVTYLYMVLIGTLVLNSFIDAWHSVYKMHPISQHRHITGYVQLVKIFLYLIATLIVVSVVFKKEVSTLVAGLGAMAAVLILVFKDTILGLVASIQLSANNMLKVGDWITIPGREVDGNVTDITLNTVKVKNFDRTIVTVPTYALVNESFQNWEGMVESGSRRIKRAFFIDMKSIRFADDKIKSEFTTLMSEVSSEWAEKSGNVFPYSAQEKSGSWFMGGTPTNLGYFRYYAEMYIKNHPFIDNSQSVILRHREPEGNGLPLQVYAFSNRTDFLSYENTQSEIFEHLIAVMNRFGLKVYQQPTGYDILEFSSTFRGTSA